MATAAIQLTDTTDDIVAVKVDFSPNGADPDSGAHQLALVALEAVQRHLADVQKLNEQPPPPQETVGT